MDIITADWETYYSKEYSLSKMTTEAYIRDPNFEPIGIGVKVNEGTPVWYSGDDFEGFLSQYDWANSAVLCHNTVFDGAIFSWRYGIKAKLWLDTLSMARPLHSVQVGQALKNLAIYYNIGEKGDEVVNALGKRRADFTPYDLAKYGAYCANDVELTYKLFKLMQARIGAPELLVIHQTLKMFIDPMLELDVPMLKAHLTNEQDRKHKLLLEVAGENDIELARKSLMSNEKLANLLQVLGVAPPQKLSPTTGKVTWAFSKTDKKFLDLQDHDDPRVRTVAAARLGVKSSIEETRTENLIGVASRGSLPVMLNYYGAHTGRFSGGDKMNLQNLPRGGTLRRSIKAPKGKKLVACDSSQIEARVVALIAEQNDLVAAFRAKKDVYSEHASFIYGYTVTKADKVPRFVGKTSILGLGYGMGAEKYRRTLEIGQGGISLSIPIDEAAKHVGQYRQKYHKITGYWKRCKLALHQMEKGHSGSIGAFVTFKGNEILLPNGLTIQYPALSTYKQDASFEPGYRCISDARQWRELIKRRAIGEDIESLTWTRLYGGKITENIVQALARIVVAEQMILIGKRYPVVLQVHDEVVVCVDEDEAEEAKAFMEVVMSTPPKWMPTLPVACEAGIGDNYGECK